MDGPPRGYCDVGRWPASGETPLFNRATGGIDHLAPAGRSCLCRGARAHRHYAPGTDAGCGLMRVAGLRRAVEGCIGIAEHGRGSACVAARELGRDCSASWCRLGAKPRKIHFPEGLRMLDPSQLPDLATEIRDFLVGGGIQDGRKCRATPRSCRAE